jgi:hypothetical protein
MVVILKEGGRFKELFDQHNVKAECLQKGLEKIMIRALDGTCVLESLADDLRCDYPQFTREEWRQSLEWLWSAIMTNDLSLIK